MNLEPAVNVRIVMVVYVKNFGREKIQNQIKAERQFLFAFKDTLYYTIVSLIWYTPDKSVCIFHDSKDC